MDYKEDSQEELKNLDIIHKILDKLDEINDLFKEIDSGSKNKSYLNKAFYLYKDEIFSMRDKIKISGNVEDRFCGEEWGTIESHKAIKHFREFIYEIPYLLSGHCSFREYLSKRS